MADPDDRPSFRIADSLRTHLPDRTAAELERYLNCGPVGLSGFTLRLLSGDAYGAARVADDENRAALGTLLAMIAQDFPADCYGSLEAVEFWKGLRHGPPEQPFDVPGDWTLTVAALRREGPSLPEPSAKRNRGDLN